MATPRNHPARLAAAGTLLALGCCALVALTSPTVRAEPLVASPVAVPVDFARDVQPILAAKCVECHGPGVAEAGLRLDDPRIALAELDSGLHAIAPGKPEESELLRRITAEEGERMPPEGPPLEAEQVAVLERWIAAGVDWPDHWAYQPLLDVAPPRFDDPADESWPRTPVDRFILQELRARGLEPSPEADRRTWLRRVYYDLTGLPPTPEQVAAFLADQSPDAYEQVVDALLASPRYGERWARHWMDVVHYADSHGFEHDMPRSAWPYRDYLVKAFNADKPYAEFIREQVAGDAIRPGDADALVATGFLATGPWDLSTLQVGQMDTDDYRLGQYLDRDDMVSTVMSTFASSTVHCARCHDHKFDPISQADYYSLQAVFAGIDKAARVYDPDPAVAGQRRQLVERRAQVDALLAAADPALLAPELQAQVAAWERQQAGDSAWQVLEPVAYSSAEGAELVKQPDGSLLATGARPEKDIYTVVAHAVGRTIKAIRVEVMADATLPQGGPGRQENGNLHLTELVMHAAPVDDPAAEKNVKLTRPQADFNQMPGWTINDALDNVAETGWGIYPEVGRTHRAVFELAEPIESAGPVALTFALHQTLGRGHLIGRVRLAVAEEPQPLSLETATFPAPVSAVLAVDPAARTEDQQRLLAAFYLQRQLDEQLAALPDQQTVYCGTNQFQATGGLIPAPAPRPVHLLERGEITKPGSVASPGTIKCITDFPSELDIADASNEGSRRAALADWLASEQNVLAWRSIANRVWLYHFGQGLVATPNDFGRMGAPPSHPELLDWLAAELQRRGGSLKSLHRLMVLSAAYRQSSAYSATAAAVDADNRYLWRMNSRRLDAEAVRDSILQFSGKLNLEMGGPPVKQFVETRTFNMRPEADYQLFDADDPANCRRSIYRFIYRTMPDPLMAALDCPDGTQMAPKRNESITALQALAMVNDKFMIRQSEHLASRLEQSSDQLPEQIDALYQLVLNRDAKPAEQTAVANYANQHGLANACRFVLNSNELMFVD